MINGMINIYKEAGFTSHDVVAKMRGICKQKKIGHTGTLDPQATGVLPVCLGSGTKLCDMLTDKDKEYVATMLLGTVTDTQDTTGQVLETHATEQITEEQVLEAMESFVGEYDQIPPMYSALKVNGKKLYELARAGKEVERKPRRIQIYELSVLQLELPRVTFRVSCSKGTYIRTLCADIGAKLGCGAAMERLERTKVAGFRIEDAITLGELQELANAGTLEQHVYSVESAFEGNPGIHVKPEFQRFLDNGNRIYPNQIVEEKAHQPGLWVKVYDCQGRFRAIYEFTKESRCYTPVKMFME